MRREGSIISYIRGTLSREVRVLLTDGRSPAGIRMENRIKVIGYKYGLAKNFARPYFIIGNLFLFLIYYFFSIQSSMFRMCRSQKSQL